MRWTWFALVLCVACGQKPQPPPKSTLAQPELSGDGCALYRDKATCSADTQDGCHWVSPPTGAPCMVQPDGGTVCPSVGGSGSCVGPSSCGPPVPGGGGGGTACGRWTDSASCAADTADACYWFGAACPQYIQPDGGMAPCQGGSCVARLPPPGPCDGGLPPPGAVSAGCGCATPAGTTGTYVCVQQIGGTASPTGPVPISCQQLDPTCTSTQPCDCVRGQGTCKPSPNVSGLCVCDNGVR